MISIKLPRLYSVDEFPWPNPYEEKWSTVKFKLQMGDLNSLYPHTIKAIAIPSSRQPNA